VRYPYLSVSSTKQVAEARIEGLELRYEPLVEWCGAGDEVDLGPIASVNDDLRRRHEKFAVGADGSDVDRFEGIVSGGLHQALGHLPIEVLDDPGFWRYLTIAELWWFVSWREAKALAKGNLDAYIDGTRPTECVVLRCFLRGQAVGCDGDYTLAAAIPNGTDFWRSHVLRVRTGTAPSLTRAFAREQVADRMPTDELRAFARRLNRTWTNILLHVYDEPESEALMADLRQAPAPATELVNP
jgi:hypothetical protein